MRRLLIASLVLSAAAAQAAPAKLTDATVRAFVERQEAAWNGKDAAAFAATFTPDARFVDQAVGSDNKVVVNGTSTLEQATAQAGRFFARSRFHATVTVDRVEIAPDRSAARVTGHEVTRIERPGQQERVFCALMEQTVIVVGGRLKSRGQTDTSVRCAEVNRIHRN